MKTDNRLIRYDDYQTNVYTVYGLIAKLFLVDLFTRNDQFFSYSFNSLLLFFYSVNSTHWKGIHLSIINSNYNFLVFN